VTEDVEYKAMVAKHLWIRNILNNKDSKGKYAQAKTELEGLNQVNCSEASQKTNIISILQRSLVLSVKYFDEQFLHGTWLPTFEKVLAEQLPSVSVEYLTILRVYIICTITDPESSTNQKL